MRCIGHHLDALLDAGICPATPDVARHGIFDLAIGGFRGFGQVTHISTLALFTAFIRFLMLMIWANIEMAISGGVLL
jgi:hypothetical protein